MTTAVKKSAVLSLRSLEDLKDLAEHQQVTFTGKVLSVSAVEELVKKGTGKQLHKQDFVIVDTTASCRGVAWEQHLHKLKEDGSYKIINATVRSFNGAKCLSLGNKAVITTVEDVGDVVDESTFDGSGGITVIEAEIVAVLKVETYIGCRSCSSKVVQVGTLGECSKRDAKMKISKCKSKHFGRVILEDSKGNEHKLTMFNEVFQQVVEVSGINASIYEQLLSSPRLVYTFKDETISSVSRITEKMDNLG